MSASTERKNRAAAIAAGTDKKTLAAREAEEKARKSKRKWIIGTVAVVLCIALVLISETFNTAIEKLCDALHPQYDEKIGQVKDLCAGAVLLASLYAALQALLILIKYTGERL